MRKPFEVPDGEGRSVSKRDERRERRAIDEHTYSNTAVVLIVCDEVEVGRSHFAGGGCRLVASRGMALLAAETG